MLTHPMLDQLDKLGLTGMAQAFAEIEASGEGATLMHADWLGLLVDREMTHRRDKRLAARLLADPMIAGSSAYHFVVLDLSLALSRLYARDNDAAGLYAANRLRERDAAAGIDLRDLVRVRGDFNLDLWRLGPAAMFENLAGHLAPSDVVRLSSLDPTIHSRGSR